MMYYIMNKVDETLYEKSQIYKKQSCHTCKGCHN